jgi:hypothetical protein
LGEEDLPRITMHENWSGCNLALKASSLHIELYSRNSLTLSSASAEDTGVWEFI